MAYFAEAFQGKCLACIYFCTGNTMTHLVPLLGTGSRYRSPRFCFATNSAMGKPKPVPSGFDEKKGTKRFSMSFSLTGTPVLKISI